MEALRRGSPPDPDAGVPPSRGFWPPHAAALGKHPGSGADQRELKDPVETLIPVGHRNDGTHSVFRWRMR